jgi:hypothetical protein
MAVGTLAIGSAALITGFSLASQKENQAQELDATNDSSSTIYFDKSTWASDSTWVNQTPYLRYYNGSSNGYIAMTKINDQMWYGSLSSASMTSSGGFCVRAASTGSDNYQETKWISWSTWTGSSDNLIKLSGSSDSSDNYRANYSTEALVEVSTVQGGSVEYVDDLASSANTQRVWCRPTVDWWYASSARTAVRTWKTVDGLATPTIYRTQTIQDTINNLYYWYADIPTDVTGYQFIRLQGSWDSIWNYSADCTTSANYLIHYINDSTTTTGYIDAGSLDGTTCARFLEGYTTCSNSSTNGYGAVSNIKSNWIDHLTATGALDTFNAATITDYPYAAYEAAGKTYTVAQTKTAVTTGAAKWAEMSSLAASGSGAYSLSGENKTVEDVSAVAAVGALGLIGSAGYFLLKKKRIA